jgi:hypothetical protein
MRFTSASTEGEARPRFALRHYTIPELAKMWNMSDDTVRRRFEKEPDIVRLGEARSVRKRCYVTLLIPEDVVERVYRRLTSA